ncbi:hypothetical protein [Photobacterium kishitanii]|uniref:hypothetical protein n=1 Tax=Photobacterium kishitanii TaxID=318456 RepID=UPI0004356D68|nr:hypothetical protein [Photobacterium kishitanii]PSV14358.1 hypothetical protein C0W59_15285 [Photobacterium kishitanii]CEO42223.1 hypothetical protein PPBDW_p0075 [Photobacterium kishitanii]
MNIGFNQKTAEERLVEEQLYKQISDEIQNGYKRDGLWLKAISDCDNNNDKAKSLYVKLRFQALVDEQTIECKQVQPKRKNESHMATIDSVIITMIIILIFIAVGIFLMS